MYAFLRRPKWVFGHVLVLIVVVTFANFGFWQLRRLDEVRTQNAHVAERLAAESVTLGRALADDVPYARVETRGTFVEAARTLTSPRSRDGSPGNHVLTPLETPDGTVLVDRGWVPFQRDGTPEELLRAPSGQVQVEALLMPAETGSVGQADVVRTIDPAEVAARTGTALVTGYYLQLQSSTPAAELGPLPHADPVLDEGNHLNYAVQWFLFTLVVVIGYPILIVRTARDERDGPGDAERADPRRAEALRP